MHVVVRPHLISRGVLAVMVVTAVVGVLATGVIHPSVASADPTPSCDATTCTVEFVPAGSVQQWSVPAGVSSVTVAMAGWVWCLVCRGRRRRGRWPDDGDGSGRVGRNVFGRCRDSRHQQRRRLWWWGCCRTSQAWARGWWWRWWWFVRVRDVPDDNTASRRRRRRGRRWRQQRDRWCGRQQRPRLGCDHHQRRWHRGRPRWHLGRRRFGRSRQPGPRPPKARLAADRPWRPATPEAAATAVFRTWRP